MGSCWGHSGAILGCNRPHLGRRRRRRRRLYRTFNNPPHIRQSTVHSTIYRTFNNLPHIPQSTAHSTIYRTFHKLRYIQQSTVHSTIYRTFNKLQHIPPNKNPAEYTLHASRLMPARLMPAIDFRQLENLRSWIHRKLKILDLASTENRKFTYSIPIPSPKIFLSGAGFAGICHNRSTPDNRNMRLCRLMLSSCD